MEIIQTLNKKSFVKERYQALRSLKMLIIYLEILLKLKIPREVLLVLTFPNKLLKLKENKDKISVNILLTKIHINFSLVKAYEIPHKYSFVMNK